MLSLHTHNTLENHKTVHTYICITAAAAAAAALAVLANRQTYDITWANNVKLMHK
jgi:hypothetical protein